MKKIRWTGSHDAVNFDLARYNDGNAVLQRKQYEVPNELAQKLVSSSAGWKMVESNSDKSEAEPQEDNS